MINKIIDELSRDVINFFATYGINTTAKYTPDLPGIMSYSRNFLARTLNTSSVNLDGKLYQDKLMYRVATPKLAEWSPQNNNMSAMVGYEAVGQDYVFTSSGDTMTKLRTSTDEGKTLNRDISIMTIPVEFAFITESLDQVFAITTLFYQRLVLMAELEVTLDLASNNVLVPVHYLLNWDRDSLEISYANFDNSSALNTIAFNVVISGPVFSEFYTENFVINEYELTLGIS